MKKIVQVIRHDSMHVEGYENRYVKEFDGLISKFDEAYLDGEIDDLYAHDFGDFDDSVDFAEKVRIFGKKVCYGGTLAMTGIDIFAWSEAVCRVPMSIDRLRKNLYDGRKTMMLLDEAEVMLRQNGFLVVGKAIEDYAWSILGKKEL